MENIHLKTFLVAVLTGISGTAMMTLFLYLVSYVTHKPLKVVKILGTMLTFRTTPGKGLSNSPLSIGIGILAHYLIGIAFAFVLILLCKNTLLEPTLTSVLVFGLLCGLFGIAVWKLFFILHPDPPHIPLKQYLIVLLLGHIVFGFGIWIVYVFLLPYEPLVK